MLGKTTAMVLALAKIHNYCIDQQEAGHQHSSMTAGDELLVHDLLRADWVLFRWSNEGGVTLDDGMTEGAVGHPFQDT